VRRIRMNELTLSNNTIYLRGEVSFRTVSNLSQQLYKLMRLQAHTLDCSDVTKVDSSIVALLLVALKHAKEIGTNFSITQLPEAANSLVKLYDLEVLFELTLPSILLPPVS
jgi:phospholipid transport system transporter-binding protein